MRNFAIRLKRCYVKGLFPARNLDKILFLNSSTTRAARKDTPCPFMNAKSMFNIDLITLKKKELRSTKLVTKLAEFLGLSAFVSTIWRLSDRVTLLPTEELQSKKLLSPPKGHGALELIPPDQKNYRRCYIENARCNWRGNFRCLGTGHEENGCDGEGSNRVVDPTCTEGMCGVRMVSITYIAHPNLVVIKLIDPVEHVLVAIMSKINFCNSHTRARSLNGTITESCCCFCDFTSHICRRMHPLPKKASELCKIIAMFIQGVVSGWKRIIKYQRV